MLDSASDATVPGESKPTMHSLYGNDPIRDVVCPLCQATTGRVLYKVTTAESARQFIRPAFDKDNYLALLGVIRDLWGADECRQVRCDTCDSVFAWPHVGGNAHFYNISYARHMRYPQKRWEFFAAARFVARDAAGSMLELGAGDGAFVRILRSAGVPAQSIHVVEYSDAARNQLAEIDARISVFSSLEHFMESAQPASYSHVFAFQVLEHVQRPVEHLAAFRRILRTGGLVCMAVPNPQRIEANERNGLVLDMPPAHVTRFTVQGVSALASRAGFELSHTEVEPFVYRTWFRDFLTFHFHRRLQSEGSIQSRMEQNLPWRWATVGGAFLALPSALRHSFGPLQGASLFCVLRAI
jgi:SAM-dependent methyltransferase